MYYSENSQLLMIYQSYLDQIHDLIVILKSDPDSVVKNNCNYVNA